MIDPLTIFVSPYYISYINSIAKIYVIIVVKLLKIGKFNV